MKHIIRDIIPPIIWRNLSKLRNKLSSSPQFIQQIRFGAEQSPEFYDWKYKNGKHWDKHYSESHYYPIWTVMADRIRQAKVSTIIDVGCGAGQVACLIRDIGIPKYKGVDFSPARIERARTVCPEYEFTVGNIFENNRLKANQYDCVLMLEFLEHINDDIGIIKRIHSDTLVIATVPNFPAAGHVRHFKSIKDVETRYSPFFKKLEIITILTNKRGKTFYILQGITLENAVGTRMSMQHLVAPRAT